MSDAKTPLLEVHDLKVHFAMRSGWLGRVNSTVRAVDGVSLTLQAGETLGLVGESGCGKSTLARAIIGLQPVTEGEIYLSGKRIDQLNAAHFAVVRRQIQMVFQDPFASLNPRMTVAQIIQEPLDIFELHTPRERKLRVLQLLELVGLNPRYLQRYPHEFSGGQRQRIGIARALALEPKVLVLDEPVSALDVSIQAQILNLLMELKQELKLAYLFIAHNLGVVRHLADRVGVMYLGQIVEQGPTAMVFDHARHPYTQALLSAIPVPDPELAACRPLQLLKGEIPSPDQVYAGCRFAERCPLADLECERLQPVLDSQLHQVACFKAPVANSSPENAVPAT
jgi:oligopeptide transport system ATP-binding protein